MTADLELVDGHPFRRYAPPVLPPEESLARARAWHDHLQERRSVRAFSDRPVPRELIELAIRSGSTAPSGAHQQPWTWVAVSNPALKTRIREAAEAEEARNYGGRMPPAWREALAPLGTDAIKPYLEIAPWLVVLFVQKHGVGPEGEHVKHYYARESVGIAAGFFLSAVHHMGLASLTHTPSPMAFLGELLGRPSNEQAFLLMPVGHPAEDCFVPDIHRKALSEVAVFEE